MVSDVARDQLRLARVRCQEAIDIIDGLTDDTLEVAEAVELTAPTSRWKLSDRSARELIGVHPDLQAVALRAMEISTVDFGILSGKRTIERQQELMDKGRSWVKRPEDSKHVTGHALDLVPYVGGQYTWEDDIAWGSLDGAVYNAITDLDCDDVESGYAMWGKDRAHWQLTDRPPFSQASAKAVAYLAVKGLDLGG